MLQTPKVPHRQTKRSLSVHTPLNWIEKCYTSASCKLHLCTFTSIYINRVPRWVISAFIVSDMFFLLLMNRGRYPRTLECHHLCTFYGIEWGRKIPGCTAWCIIAEVKGRILFMFLHCARRLLVVGVVVLGRCFSFTVSLHLLWIKISIILIILVGTHRLTHIG